ncbi:MAG: hypothetical protein R2874_15220 [Desulfobacterales bacterium]
MYGQFIISHCVQTMQLEDDDRVKGFIGEFTSTYPVLDTEHPATWGKLDLQDYYMEHKRAQHMAMKPGQRRDPECQRGICGNLWHTMACSSPTDWTVPSG